MKRIILTATAALTLLLGGCATTIRSDVTTFHQWPAAVEDKTYVFEAPPAQDDTLELRSYQNLVRGELAKLGFQDAGANGTPTLKVSMRFTTTDVPVRVIQAVDPFMSGYYSPFRSRFIYRGYRRPFYYNGWYGGGWYSPFYDPFWNTGPMMQETIRHEYQRELQVSIKSIKENKRLFEVTVKNNSRTMSTPAVMPALVQSAFEGFPGVNGVARTVELKRDKG
jgi:hypothetical protein